MKFDKTTILVTFLIAGFGASIGMLQNSSPANAAILVVDAENILQATKTAVNTASILSEEQKQVTLQLIDLASMPAEQRETFLRNMIEKKMVILQEQQAKEGALNSKKSANDFWDENFNGIDSILSGEINSQRAYEANQRTIKAVERTSRDSLNGAKAAQSLGRDLNAAVIDAVNSSSAANGTKEAIQANTQTIAAAATGTVVGNNLLAEILASQAIKQQKEIEEEAHALSIQKQTSDQARSNLNAMKSALR
ncbi:hypothetical protein [Anaerospora hongkongensis]|uniref:hypothetical protein n=1 Tax=Anaerospora hongkongensis TaxID=244830 RepID=UPI002FD8F7E0